MASGGFQTVDARNGSFKEVTDETPGTGQRKFARRWYRGAQRNFPPLERQRHRGSGRTLPAAQGAFVSSPHEQALRNNLRSGERKKKGGKRNFTAATQAPSFSSLPRAPSVFFVWDPRWGRSRNFLRRRGRETSPRWRSFYPGSDSPQAPAAARPAPVEAATAAGTAPPLIRSPVCSGRLWNKEEEACGHRMNGRHAAA